MKNRHFVSPHERPSAEQVEFFAREMRARAWTLHVFSPLRHLAQRLVAKLGARARRAADTAEEQLPDTVARS